MNVFPYYRMCSLTIENRKDVEHGARRWLTEEGKEAQELERVSKKGD